MTLEIFSGLVLQSFGIVGLLAVQSEAPQAESSSRTVDARETLRRQHQTSVIQRAHEGCGIDEVPNGTYGFTYAPAAVSPLFANKAFQSFEMHKAADGRQYLLGYLTKAEVERIGGNATVEVHLYPDAYEAATEFVCLPLSRLQRKSNNPTHEAGNWVTFFVSPEAQ